jgi:hypothetical protein
MKTTMEVGLRLTAVDRMSSVVNQATRRANERFKWMERGMQGFNSLSNKIFTAGGIVAAGIYQTVKAAEDAESSTRMLSNTFRQMWYGNGAAMQAEKQLESFSKKYQYHIGVEEQEINHVQSILATYTKLSNRLGVNSGLFERLTKASFDMGSMFGDAAGNANALAIAMQDPARNASRLRRRGVILKEDVPEIQKVSRLMGRHAAQMEMMKRIERQFKGTAEKTATSTQIMAIGFNDVAKTIGNVFLPYFKNAGRGTISYVDKVKKAITTHSELILKLTKYGAITLGMVAGLRILTTVTDAVIGAWKVTGILSALNTRYLVGFRLQYYALALGQKIAAAGQWLFNAAVSANPIAKTIIIVSALTAGITYAWKHFAKFRAVVKTTGDTLKQFGLLIWNYVVARVVGLIRGMQTLGRVISDVFGGNFKKALGDAKTGIDDVLGLSATKNLAVGVVGTVKSIPGSYNTIYAREKAKEIKRTVPRHSTVFNYSSTVQVHGNASREDLDKALDRHARHINQIVEKHLANKKRLSYD